MATATELVKECRICELTFVNPKLLSCHHSFCEACVNKMTKGSRLVCPNCRKECRARDIVPDFRLDEFLDALREQEEKLEQTKIEKVATESGKCELCGENDISHYCKDCAQCICSPCKKSHLNAKVSKGHTIESITSKNEKTRTILQTEVRALTTTMASYERIVASFQSESDKTKAIQLSTQDELKRLREKLHQDIDESFDALDSEVLDETENHMARLDHEKDAYVQQFQTFKTECRNVEKLINDDSQLAIHGQSIMERINKMNRSTTEPTFKSIDLHIQHDKSWDTSRIVALKVNPGRFDPYTVETPGESLESVTSKQWTRQLSVPVPNPPNSLRLIQGELWQCYGGGLLWSTGGITVYDATLQPLRTINGDGMSWVYDVAPMPGGEVVVAAYYGLYKMTTSGQQRDQISEGRFTGVVQHRGRIYAVNSDTYTAHVYQHLDGWTKSYSFSVNATKGPIITLGVSKDLLYTCTRGEHRVGVFSLSGELQYSTGSEGSGAAGLLNQPLICATDAVGAALIADRRNHRLQVVGSSQWSTVSLQPPMRSPNSALFLGGKLYSSSWTAKTLHMYA